MMWTAALASVLALTLAQTIPPQFGIPDLSTHKEVKAEVEINASAETVWHVLTDFSAYEIWNPYIYPASGEAVTGHQVDVTLHGGTVVRYTPTVLVAKPREELSWGGRIPFGAIERHLTFEIQTLEPHHVRFTATEQFRGILLPLASGVTSDSAAGLSVMAKALRNRAEVLDFSLPKPDPVHMP